MGHQHLSRHKRHKAEERGDVSGLSLIEREIYGPSDDDFAPIHHDWNDYVQILKDAELTRPLDTGKSEATYDNEYSTIMSEDDDNIRPDLTDATSLDDLLGNDDDEDWQLYLNLGDDR